LELATTLGLLTYIASLTLKGFLTCRTLSGLLSALVPLFWILTQGCANPGLELANAFGVQTAPLSPCGL